MSLTSWALVLREHETRWTARGGLSLSGHGEPRARRRCCSASACWPARAAPTTSPASARATRQTLAQTLVLFLALLGAGSKAGLVPLHVWLPPAHAAAPSHVSALMSGVMTKVAVYAAMRILFDLAGPPAWWWGAVLMLLGAVSAVLGLLYAAHADRPEAPPGLQHGRESRADLHRTGFRAGLHGQRPAGGRCHRALGGTAARAQPHAVQGPAVHGRRCRAARDAASATWTAWAG